MENQNEPLETLSEIRSMMERSSRFISLSGLSGICAGIFALIGTGVAYWRLNLLPSSAFYYENVDTITGLTHRGFYIFYFVNASCVLIASLAAGIFFTVRKAKKKGLKVWDPSGKRLLINMLIPLATGGFFCLILFLRNGVPLIAPATLIFYGLALVNASKYTFNYIRYLGVSEIIAGLLATYFYEYGLLFWAIGFGLLHIIYGILMYYTYESSN